MEVKVLRLERSSVEVCSLSPRDEETVISCGVATVRVLIGGKYKCVQCPLRALRMFEERSDKVQVSWEGSD